MTLDGSLLVVVDAPPVPKGRARVVTLRSGKVAAFTPKRTYAASLQVGWLMKLAWRMEPDADSHFDVDMVFYVRSPKTRGDLDNFVKLVLDAGNGVIWADDQQVTVAKAQRLVDRKNPRTEIQIRRLTVDDPHQGQAAHADQEGPAAPPAAAAPDDPV